ncbi:hypothetical protein [Streptomyces viridosporus]|uniref:hypothetical protein n=1 Tax=Streptomyces viridosporus TaxID=67581 RepID=UPI0036FC6F16
MADEQDRWLDRETAERLLSGEPPGTADPAARERAERLARTLGALSAPLPSTGGELPGEAAALAAFRAAREGRAEGAAPDADTGRPTGSRPSDVGLIRLGSPHGDRSGTTGGSRWTRPLRFGLAAALAAGVVGGAATLAGTGVLPALSGGSGSDPDASVTAADLPSGHPLPSPPPKTATSGGAVPESGTDRGSRGAAQDGPGAREDEDASGSGKPGPDAGDFAARSGRGWKQIASACRDLRDGKGLGGDRKRLVEGAAGGSSRVDTYCADVLAALGTGPTAGERADGEAHRGKGDGNGGGKGNGDSGGGKGNGSTGGHGETKGEAGGSGGQSDKSVKSDKSDKSGKGDKGGEKGRKGKGGAGGGNGKAAEGGGNGKGREG